MVFTTLSPENGRNVQEETSTLNDHAKGIVCKIEDPAMLDDDRRGGSSSGLGDSGTTCASATASAAPPPVPTPTAPGGTGAGVGNGVGNGVGVIESEDKKPKIGGRPQREQLQVRMVKVSGGGGGDKTSDSGESSKHEGSSPSIFEGKVVLTRSSKHEGSSPCPGSIFEDKVVAVTRSSSRRKLGLVQGQVPGPPGSNTGPSPSPGLGLGVQPVTPRLEEPRSVRPNRGMKRRYPGEESDENNSSRKRIRVRSISRVSAPNGQPIAASDLQPTKGKVSAVVQKDWKQPIRGQRRGRQSEIFYCNFEGCEKSFTESSALYNHGRVHGDRPYICHYEGCSKRFSERSKLKRHFLIHTGEKPFICDYEGCGKAFSLDFNLRSHMKTHTGEYHECPHSGCEKRYCQEYKLRAHICKEHKGTGNGNSNKFTVTESGGGGAGGGRNGGGGAAAGGPGGGAGTAVAAATAAGGGAGNRMVVVVEESMISSNDKASKKRQRMEQLQAQIGKLEKNMDGRKSRIKELHDEAEREEKELAKLEKALRKAKREREREQQQEQQQQQQPQGLVDRVTATAADLGGECDLSCSDNNNNSQIHNNNLAAAGEAELVDLGDMYGDEKEVVMFAHKLPTADQGARLMDQVVLIEETSHPLSPSISSSQEPFLMSRLHHHNQHHHQQHHQHPSCINNSSHHNNNPFHIPFMEHTSVMTHSSAPAAECFYINHNTNHHHHHSNQGSSEDQQHHEHHHQNNNKMMNGDGSGSPMQQEDTSPGTTNDPEVGGGGGGSGGFSPIFSTSCHNSQAAMSFFHEQSSQCEPPVSQLFTYQEQPVLV